MLLVKYRWLIILTGFLVVGLAAFFAQSLSNYSNEIETKVIGENLQCSSPASRLGVVGVQCVSPASELGLEGVASVPWEPIGKEGGL